MEIGALTVRDFIKYIVKFKNVEEILNKCSTSRTRSLIFERLYDIIIKFGFCEKFNFNNEKYYHLTGNVDKCELKILRNFDEYLEERVIKENTSEYSIITLQDKNTDKYVFISVKYSNGKKNSDYGIQNIISIVSNNIDIYSSYKIYLIVENKKNTLSTIQQVNELKYIKEQFILDQNDLDTYFIKFKKDIINNINENWNDLYFTKRTQLKLRFHQELIARKTSNLIEEGNKSFLWGCKCRSGKTFMFGGLLIKQLQVIQKLNVLIITPAPSETMAQFTDDLFYRYTDFDSFNIYRIDSSETLMKIIGRDDNTEDVNVLPGNNIFIMSKQLLQKYTDDNALIELQQLEFDIIGFDENHFSGTTDISKKIIDTYSNNLTIKIFLTATYNKPLLEWNIDSECQIYWDIEDEQICKNISIDNSNINKLFDKHGEYHIKRTLDYFTRQNYNIDKLFEQYLKMPELYILTNMFDIQKFEVIKNKMNIKHKYGFCFETLFCLDKKKQKLIHEEEIKKILNYISGSIVENDDDRTIFTRISQICENENTRIPFTQIWFLPPNNIGPTSKYLKTLMEQDTILCNYDILIVNRTDTNLEKDIKSEIIKHELKAKKTGKNGLIILSGNMLSLGITLELCDLVILLNNTISSDKVFQQMYRCMTEGNNKKYGFVVDLNVSRVLNTCINYTIFNKTQTVEDKLNYLIKYKLINIDTDLIQHKDINTDTLVSKLMNIWKNDPINNFKMLLHKLDDDYREFDTDTQKLINSVFINSAKNKKSKNDIAVNFEVDDRVEIIIDTPQINKKVVEEKDDTHIVEEPIQKQIEQVKYISFTKDILPYVIPLTCILTIRDKNLNFVKMLNDIKNNKDLLEIFNDQCFIWWNKNDLLDLIKNIVDKYFNGDSNTSNVTIQFKLSIQSLIDSPKELLELINDCLKPKDIEKKKYGEVFTPMILINEMLDKLPVEVWTNKNLKWFDPATGMGNFPISIYLRLMNGLKNKIKNEHERKKYILENMLYVSELNKKNVWIYKQIFDINNEYKLNVFEGDTLQLNIKDIFKIDKFDIIVGNPPYQKENKKSDAAKGGTNNNLYIDFISMSINILNENGYLLFINPINWRKIGSVIFNEFIQRNIYYIKLNYGGDLFENVSVNTDYYILKNSMDDNFTSKIEYICDKELHTENVILSKTLQFIPNVFNNIINSILEKINLYGTQYECIISSDCHKIRQHVNKGKTDIFTFQLFNTSGNPFEYFSSKAHKHQYNKKIIMSNSGKLNPFYDDGLLGTTQDSMYILVNSKEEGTMLVDTLKSKLFTFLIKICQWGNFRNESQLFTYLKYPNIIQTQNKKIDDTFLTKYYKLNDVEIQFINKYNI